MAVSVALTVSTDYVSVNVPSASDVGDGFSQSLPKEPKDMPELKWTI